MLFHPVLTPIILVNVLTWPLASAALSQEADELAELREAALERTNASREEAEIGALPISGAAIKLLCVRFGGGARGLRSKSKRIDHQSPCWAKRGMLLGDEVPDPPSNAGHGCRLRHRAALEGWHRVLL